MEGTSEKRVLIGIPVWNRAQVIGKCLESLCSMNYPKSLISIAIVGGGTDSTSAIVRQFADSSGKEYRSFQFKEIDCSLPKARNMVLDSLSDQHYVWFIDSDVLVNPESLSRAIMGARTADIVFLEASFEKSASAQSTDARESYVRTDCVGMGCTLIEGNLARELRFDERLTWLPEDEDFCLRAEDKLDRKLICLIDSSEPVQHVEAARQKWRARWRRNINQRSSNAWNVNAVFRERRLFKLAHDGRWVHRSAFYSVLLLCVIGSLWSWPLILVPLAYWLAKIASTYRKTRSLKISTYDASVALVVALTLLPSIIAGEIELLRGQRNPAVAEKLAKARANG